MTYILTAWKESARLLWTRSGFLLFLVTLKTIGQGYKTWLKYWGWLLVVMVALPVALISHFKQSSSLSFIAQATDIFIPVAWMISFFMLVLAIRSSVYRKTYDYFLSYMRHIGWLLLALVVVALCIGAVIWTDVYITRGGIAWLWNSAIISSLWKILSLVRTGFILFFLCFFFDSTATLGSIIFAVRRAAQMFVYTAPVSVCATLILGFFQWCFFWALGYVLVWCGFMAHESTVILSGLIFTIADLLFMAFWISAFSNIYIKNLYDHMERYFPR